MSGPAGPRGQGGRPVSILKIRICVLIIVVANAVGNVLLGHGMRQIGSIASYSPLKLVVSSLRAAANPYVLAGVGFLVIFFLAHMIALSLADLSYILPVTSVGYIFVTLLSWWWLGENISPMRWLGTLTIVLGVVLVSSTPEVTSRAAPADPPE